MVKIWTDKQGLPMIIKTEDFELEIIQKKVERLI
jgi:hypothetical protein